MMSYKDILVQVDDSTACMARTEAAIELAGRFDAHMTALYLLPEMMLPVAVEGYIGADMYTSIEQQERERGEAVLNRFREAAKATDVEYDTRTDRGAAAEFSDRLEVHSRCADLLIIGQPDQEEDSPTAPSPGDVALAAAAPVLVVPFIGMRQGFGARPMIAWKRQP